MSHCTRFEMSFTDKRSLFKAMRNLNLKPENKVWAEYSSHFAKKLDLSKKIIGKLLTGCSGNLNVFFVESEIGLIPHFESPVLGGGDLERVGKTLLVKLRQEYVRCVLQEYLLLLQETGPATASEVNQGDSLSFIIKFGEIGEKSINVNVDNNGVIIEDVSGVLGRSCIDATKSIEQKMNINQLQRNWTHEYNAEIEDQVIQVLKLS